MNSHFRDLSEVLFGLGVAIVVGAAIIVIGLALFGFFDQGTRYRFPPCHPGSIQAMFTSCDQRAAKEYRR